MVFNLGGDLNLFRGLIDEQNYEGLLSYVTQCINILYQNMFHFNLELTTVSLIQGDTLGGGFEAALSSNLIIAERGVKLGLPEVLFHLFPDMGRLPYFLEKEVRLLLKQILLFQSVIKTVCTIKNEEMFSFSSCDHSDTNFLCNRQSHLRHT